MIILGDETESFAKPGPKDQRIVKLINKLVAPLASGQQNVEGEAKAMPRRKNLQSASSSSEMAGKNQSPQACDIKSSMRRQSY